MIEILEYAILLPRIFF